MCEKPKAHYTILSWIVTIENSGLANMWKGEFKVPPPLITVFNWFVHVGGKMEQPYYRSDNTAVFVLKCVFVSYHT